MQVDGQDEDAGAVVAMIVDRLTAYLFANPCAGDTADGITRWWLGGDPAARPDLLDQALRILQQRGLVESVAAADGRQHYRGLVEAGARDTRGGDAQKLH